MSKLSDREDRRKSVVSRMVSEQATVPAPAPESAGKRGRPKADRETKKRISLAVMPSLYEDIQKIAYVQRRSTSELVAQMMEEHKAAHDAELKEYQELHSAQEI